VLAVTTRTVIVRQKIPFFQTARNLSNFRSIGLKLIVVGNTLTHYTGIKQLYVKSVSYCDIMTKPSE